MNRGEPEGNRQPADKLVVQGLARDDWDNGSLANRSLLAVPPETYGDHLKGTSCSWRNTRHGSALAPQTQCQARAPAPPALRGPWSIAMGLACCKPGRLKKEHLEGNQRTSTINLCLVSGFDLWVTLTLIGYIIIY